MRRVTNEVSGTLAVAPAGAATVDLLTGHFTAASVQVVCPTGTVGSLDFIVYGSLRRVPSPAEDWVVVGNGTVAPGASTIVDVVMVPSVRRHVRVVLSRNGADASAYRVYGVGLQEAGQDQAAAELN